MQKVADSVVAFCDVATKGKKKRGHLAVYLHCCLGPTKSNREIVLSGTFVVIQYFILLICLSFYLAFIPSP